MKVKFKFTLSRSDGFLLTDINKGIVHCRKNGFSPSLIILGKKEVKEAKCVTYSGARENDGMVLVKGMLKNKILNIDIVESDEETELTFICNDVFP